MKKILAMVLSLALVATMAITGSIAYLQDTDEAVNVMTLGNVYIDQIEQERDESGGLVKFTQAKPAYPAVGPIAWDEDGVDVNGTKYKVFTEDLKNVVDKIVTVKNTGKSDAFVRTIVAIEAPDYDPTDLIHMNYNPDGLVMSAPLCVEIDGVKYVCFTFTYNEALKPQAISAPSLMQLFLDSATTNEDCAKFGDAWDVLVVSQAVQTAGFEATADKTAAQVALDTAFGEANEANVIEWFDDLTPVDFVEVDGEKVQILGEEAAKILEDLKAGGTVVVEEDVDILAFDTNDVDANGAKVTLNGQGSEAYGYLAFMPDAGENVTVKNLNVTGAGFVEVGHYGQGGGTYTVNNVKIENLASTLANGDKGFTLGCAFCHYGTATLTDCVMTGATAVQDGVIPVDLGCVNDTTTTINGGEYGTIYCWSHAIVTVNGADVDTLWVSPIKGTVTVKAGTKIDTLKVDYGTSAGNVTKARLEKLVIEDGATVDVIAYNGETYTVAEWNTFVTNFGA